ncbi:MAG: hypothetical protein ACOCZK_03470 [Planctomycetota bacterium]
MRRLVTALALTLSGLAGAPAEEGPEPLPSLPPSERPLAIDPRPGGIATSEPEARVPVDRSGLIADITAMNRARERLRRLLEAGEIAGVERPREALEPAAPMFDDGDAQDAGEPVAVLTADRLGENQLLRLARFRGDQAWVTARITNLRVEVVYRELMSLLERSVDDQQIGSTRRMVDLHVRDLAWQEALTRLLGQVGLGWHEGPDAKIMIHELTERTRDPARLRALAQRAFRNAARDADDPYSAEAIYRMAAYEHRLARRENEASRYWAAMERYLDVIENFDRNNAAFRPARPWVRRAIRGYGEALMELEQYRDARGVFMRYISKAESDDPHLPEVYFAAAKASRKIYQRSVAVGRSDESARIQAVDLLEVLLNRFAAAGEDQGLAGEAQLMLGRLLLDRGEYAAAKDYLARHLARSGDEHAGDAIRFDIAECDYNIALRRRRQGEFAAADNALDAALQGYRFLTEQAQAEEQDELADSNIYRTAFFRIGQCHLLWSEPDYVKALFAFLRAQRRYRNSPIDEDLVVHIARCYSELQSREQLVDELYRLLESDRLHDDRAGVVQIEQLLGDIKGNLTDYGANVRAKVLFYIAQAKYAAAMQHPRHRAGLLKQAIHEYERVIRELDGSGSLAVSAKLGLARAAVQAGDEIRGEQALKEILRAHRSGQPNRDVMYAAQLLGDHYQRQGKFRRAISAYRAEVDDVQQ